MANFLIFLGMVGSKDLIDLLMQSGSEVCVSTTQHPMPVLPKGTAVLKEPETADDSYPLFPAFILTRVLRSAVQVIRSIRFEIFLRLCKRYI